MSKKSRLRDMVVTESGSASEAFVKLTKSSSSNDDMRIDGKYVPRIYCTDMDKTLYPDEALHLRFLPKTTTMDYPHFYFPILTHYFKYGDFMFSCNCPKTEGKEVPCPICAARTTLYKNGSEFAKEIAKKLFPRMYFYMNVIIREVQLLNERGEKKMYRNVGPRILRVPESLMEKIVAAFNTKDIGNPLDLDSARDFVYHVNKKTSGKIVFPNYENSRYSYSLSPLTEDPDEEERILSSMYDLKEEYKRLSDKEYKEYADKVLEIFKTNGRCLVQEESDEEEIDPLEGDLGEDKWVASKKTDYKVKEDSLGLDDDDDDNGGDDDSEDDVFFGSKSASLKAGKSDDEEGPDEEESGEDIDDDDDDDDITVEDIDDDSDDDDDDEDISEYMKRIQSMRKKMAKGK